MTFQSEIVVDSKCTLGEGPVWHDTEQKLYWVDIEGKAIWSFDPKTTNTEKHDFEEMPGAVVPTDQGDFLVAFQSSLSFYDWKSRRLQSATPFITDQPMVRSNDGKCDPAGRFWIGTMHFELEVGAGALFSFDADGLMQKVPTRTISNGLAWTKDHQIMYYIDTWDNQVRAYDFDKASGTIQNERTVIKTTSEMGGADGMCIDENDKLWIAHWGGNCVRQWDPETGKEMSRVEVAAPHVTSCCFGGENLDKLYITTACTGLSEESIEKYPLSGGVFVSDVGVSGTSATPFKKKVK